MKVTSTANQQIASKIQHNFTDIKSVSEKTIEAPSFQQRLGEGLQNVANAQNNAAELAKSFELGTEHDLAKVMVSQQVSSLAFQLTLNVRNKALSAYKDIMNMPV